MVGTGRCGSTIVYSVLAMHPNLAWIASWVSAFPRLPALSLANRLWDVPGIDRHLEGRFFPKPVEPNKTFEHVIANYYTEQLNDEIVEEARAKLVPLLARIQHFHGKPRFLGKLVGRPVKIDLLARLYPDAHFVHITRDLKPTVSSMLRVDFYGGWGKLKDYRRLLCCRLLRLRMCR